MIVSNEAVKATLFSLRIEARRALVQVETLAKTGFQGSKRYWNAVEDYRMRNDAARSFEACAMEAEKGRV